MKGIGRVVQFGIAKETTRGTPNTAADFWIPFSELDFQEKFDNIIDEESRGLVEDSTGASRVKNWAEGSIKAPVEDKSFPLVLYAALGSKAVATNSDVSGAVFDHTITVGQSAQHQALSLYINDPLSGQDYKHGNGVIDTLELNYELGKFLYWASNMKAKKGATATLTPSNTAYNRFLPAHLTFKLASSYSGLGAASATVIKSLKLSINNNVEADDVLGSSDPADFLNKQFSIEGTIEAMWQNESDFKTAALAGTTKAMRIDMINSDVVIGTAANPELRIDLAKVIFKEITRPLKLNDMVMQTLSFKAHYSLSDSLMVTILATNTQASY